MIPEVRYLLRGLLPLGLVVVVVLAGFLLLFSNQNRLFQTEQQLNGRIHNATNGKALGELIVSQLGIVSTRFYMALVSADTERQKRLLKEVDVCLGDISAAARVLSKGGVYSRRLPLGRSGSEAVSYDLAYDPDQAHIAHIDFPSLERQLVDLKRLMGQTLELTRLRNTLLQSDNSTELHQAGLEIRAFENQVSSHLQQVSYLAGLIVSNTTGNLAALTRSVNQGRAESRQHDIRWTVSVILLVCGFIALVLRQVSSSQRRLEKTINQLEQAKANLADSHAEILALNETLEQEVERRTAELTVSEQQWSDAFNAISTPMFIHDKKGRIIKANQAYLDTAGVSLEQAVGEYYWTVFPRRNMPLPGCLCTPHEINEKSRVTEMTLQVDDRMFRSQSFVVRNREGGYLYGMHLLEDVTEKARIRKELQASEKRFRDVTNSIDESLILVDREQRILMLNRAAERTYHLNSSDYIGQHCHDIFHHQGVICDDCSVAEVFASGRLVVTQKRLEDGRVLDLKIYPICTDDGEVTACTIVTSDISERVKYIENLRRYQQIVSTSRDIVAFFDTDHRYLAVNAEYASYFNLSEQDIVGRHASDIIGRERYNEYLTYQDQVFMEKTPLNQRLWVDYPARGRRFMDISVFPYVDDEGAVIGLVVRGQDLTERNEQEERLRLAAKVLESTSEGIVITDCQGQIMAVNPAFTRITGYREDEVAGKNPRILKSGRHDDSFYREMWLSLQESGQWRGEIWNRRKDGEVYPELLTITTMTSDAETTHYVAVFSDISAIKKTSEKLEHLAHHNALTGLPNRRLLQARLEHSLQNARREGTRGAVIYIDLDNFKKINDSLGHSAGDEVLKTVAERLMKNARQVDTVAHLSGDEFVIVLHKTKTIDDAITRAEQIIAGLQQPFQVENYELFISGSLGIAEYDATTQDIETLLKNADAAMYKAKESGKNRYHVYSPELTEQAVERVLMESHLRRALDRNELVLFYQPQIDMTSGRIVAAEALLRWEHPDLGIVPPDKFIPLSEETGLIIPIGEWVLRTACRQMMAWRKRGLGLKRIAVNVSGKQIQLKDLHKMVEQVLIETGLPSGSLELEITEGFIMQHPEQSIAVLQSIRNLGVELSIDDFGTGHSSLNYLKRLPINRLKIDRTFVNDICDEMEGEAITRAVIAMGRSLNLQITAEGVETPEQHEFLDMHGCHEAQGFLFCRPLPAEKMQKLLESDTVLTRYAC